MLFCDAPPRSKACRLLCSFGPAARSIQQPAARSPQPQPAHARSSSSKAGIIDACPDAAAVVCVTLRAAWANQASVIGRIWHSVLCSGHGDLAQLLGWVREASLVQSKALHLASMGTPMVVTTIVLTASRPRR